MIRILIGAFIILSAFIVKAILNHNIQYWGPIKSWTSITLIIGLVVICFPLLRRNQAWRTKVSNLSPGKTALQAMQAILVPVLIIVLTILIENAGGWANEKIVSYYLSKETITTEGTITELVQVPYLTKRGKRYEPFYLVQYSTANELIQQGLKPQVGVAVGNKVKVEYSSLHPTIFKVE